MRPYLLTLLFLGGTLAISAQYKELKLKKQTFELHNVTGSIIKIQGKKVLKIERDLEAIPFDVNNIEATVDEPHYAHLVGLEDFEHGTIEVDMYSQLQILCLTPVLPGLSGYIFEFNLMIPPLRVSMCVPRWEGSTTNNIETMRFNIFLIRMPNSIC